VSARHSQGLPWLGIGLELGLWLELGPVLELV